MNEDEKDKRDNPHEPIVLVSSSSKIGAMPLGSGMMSEGKGKGKKKGVNSPDSLKPLLGGEENEAEASAHVPVGSDPEEETTLQHQKKSKGWITGRDLRDWWFADGPKFLWYVLWLAGQAAIGMNAAVIYWNNPNYYITVARINGAMLNLNCALILIPVSRNLLTWARKTFLSAVVPFDKNLVWHRHIAWAIAIQGVLHGAAHYLNYNTTEIPWTLAWATLAGSTGHIISICMLIMYSAAWDTIRRKYFNAFYFSHYLFIIFYGCLLAHGPRFWYYFIVPGTIYALERLVREIRGRKITTVVSAVKNHPSQVIEIRMLKKRFNYKPGQYLFLNCPAISQFEWHPFTISSCPEDEYVSVHIRQVGDWTKAIGKLLGGDPKTNRKTLVVNKSLDEEGRAMLRLDGPFGAASEEVFQYRVAVLIAGGIGVTPFASILKSIRARLLTGQKCGRLEKVYFFWTSRDQTAFEWFQALLSELEVSLAAEGLSDFLEVNIYLTGRMKIDEIRSLMSTARDSVDSITHLHSKTNFGRPPFAQIFKRIEAQHPKTRVGVFFCGPKVMSSSLNEICHATSRASNQETRFIFMKENF